MSEENMMTDAAVSDPAVNEDAAAPAPVEDTPQETMEDYAGELNASMKKIKEGDILKGTVIGISDTEVTLDLGYYAEGIIRLEDLSEDPAFSIKTDVTMGEEITATVIRVDNGEGSILLSRKEANSLLVWDKLRKMLEDKTNVSVKVVETVKSGVVAFLEGVRGFIPASKLALSYVEEDALDTYLNKTLEVRVITADEKNHRLVLSARDILKEKADAERANKISNVQVGLVTEGTVESLQNYGAFVDLGNGLSGLVHISQICEKRIKHPGAVLKEGDKVKVKVTAIKDGKLSLSMKALNDVAAEEIVEESYDLPKSESLGTSLGDIFKNLNLS